MRYFYITVIYFLLICNISAQDLEQRLRVDNEVDCSVYANNANRLIGNLDIHNLDSVKAILDIWERECGKSEPIMRLRLLHQIYQENYISESFNDYYDQYIRKYIYRVEVSKSSTSQSYFENNKSYYDYTDLGLGFDQHTENLANYLLPLQAKNSDAYLMCLLFSHHFKRFEELSYHRSNSKSPLIKSLYHPSNGLFSNTRFIGGLGLWMPIGTNQHSFSASPMITIGFEQPIGTHWRMDSEFTITPLVNSAALDFHFDGQNHSSQSLVAIKIGGGFSRVNVLTDKWFLDTGMMLGVNILDTDIDDSESEESDQSIATLDLGFRVSIRRKMKNGKSLALVAGYHWAPYNWSKNLKSEVGDKYTTLSLAFGF